MYADQSTQRMRPKPPSAIPATGLPTRPTARGAPPAVPPITSSAGDGFGSPPGGVGGVTRVAPPAPIPAAPAMGGLPAPSPALGLPAQGPASQPFTTTPINPATGLSTQTIAAGPALDRYAVAQQQYDTFVKGTEPSYQAALRDAQRAGAAMGGIGSGQLRTSIGDLGNTRANALQGERSSLFNTALLGSVDDARFATGVAQQQQGTQIGQQNDAFNRALQTWLAGQSGGTGSGTVMQGAGAARGTSSDALAALQSWMAQRAAQPAQSESAPAPVQRPAPDPLPAWLQPYTRTPAYSGRS